MVTETYHCILFISGMSVKSLQAIENIKGICNEYLKDRMDLKIIDVSKEQDKAAEYQILALPTLIKSGPKPARTILGNLSDKNKVLKILDIL
jgi:circadian clock protein KaiB